MVETAAGLEGVLRAKPQRQGAAGRVEDAHLLLAQVEGRDLPAEFQGLHEEGRQFGDARAYVEAPPPGLQAPVQSPREPQPEPQARLPLGLPEGVPATVAVDLPQRTVVEPPEDLTDRFHAAIIAH